MQHDAEGPSAGKLKLAKGAAEEGMDAAEVERGVAPPIAVPLPTGSAYYLLDDFNHHHQHAVLTGTTARYASTHR